MLGPKGSLSDSELRPDGIEMLIQAGFEHKYCILQGRGGVALSRLLKHLVPHPATAFPVPFNQLPQALLSEGGEVS